jgi:hypothetical protein
VFAWLAVSQVGGRLDFIRAAALWSAAVTAAFFLFAFCSVNSLVSLLQVLRLSVRNATKRKKESGGNHRTPK